MRPRYKRSKRGISMINARYLIREGIIRPADKYIAALPDSKWCKEIVEPEGLTLEEQLEYSVGYSQRKDNDDEI